MISSNFLHFRYARLVGSGLLVAVLAGCSGGILSGAGPYSRTVHSEAEADQPAYSLVDLSAQTVGPYMRPAPKEAVATISGTDAITVRLVGGDVIKVMVADTAPQEQAVFAPLAAGGTSFELRIDADGKISLPYAGRISAAGLTLTQLETAIKKRLSGIANDPQVMVSLLGDRSGSVLVAGAVKAPGRFSALQGPLTLLDAINLAGGPILEPHLVNVVVRNGQQSASYAYDELLAGKNLPISPRSEIIVERARKRFVAMGAVGSPGLHDLPSQSPSLLETLGVVGGLKENSADPQGVFVFRLTPGQEGEEPLAQVFRLNMREPASIFIARQFLVQPEDAIYVTNAAVYEWQKIISPIVQVLLLGRTVGNL